MSAITGSLARAFQPLLFASITLLFIFPRFVSASCGAPANAIEAENCLVGNPSAQWDVSGAGDPEIQGFATDISVNKGGTISFKIDTAATAYRIEIYRLGYYNGDGARLQATIQPTAVLPQSQPSCLSDLATGLIDCGNWSISASWDVPANATSGIYVAKLVTEAPTADLASHMIFIVRDDNGGSDLLFQASDTTWQAYNNYGGNSLYQGSPAGRAYKVSYNRPFVSRATTPEDWVFNADYPMLRWLERNGYDVSYSTGIDSDRRGDEILEHKVFLSVGHDEYWSGIQRAKVEAARDAGVHLAFLSGNEVFWKTRLDPSTDLSVTPDRTLVCYKETHAGSNIGDADWTGTWRDNRGINPEGSKPENALTGTIFMVNSGTSAILVPAADGDMRFWRDTSVALLSGAQVATLAGDTLGYEWDEDLDNGFRPAGLVRLSSTTLNVPQRLLDQGSNYGPGVATHHLTLYRDVNGAGVADDALVFGAGTIQWAWGLDSVHDRGSNPADPRMQQATVNLFADMGVQPASLQAGLLLATASADTTAPTSVITSPGNSDTVSGTVTITGTASDTGGGVVGGVEVSTDNGATWHPATDGRENWSYSWNVSGSGTTTLLSRAADDSANLGGPSPGVTVTIAGATCPCTIWPPSTTPPSTTDSTAYELGVKFRADVAGFITAIRFYKPAANTGTHIGNLWTSAGVNLGSVTFSGESASGWQEATFGSPIAIDANTTYVASYHTTTGNYGFTANYFTSSSTDNPPLHALQSGIDGLNGVYTPSATSAFPTQTFNDSNYWVDVVFVTDNGPDTTAPIVTTTIPANGASGISPSAHITATFSEAMTASSIDATTFELRDPLNALVSAVVSYDNGSRTATLNPNSNLAFSTTYTATVKSGANGVKDLALNPLEADKVWTFTTSAAPPPPPEQGPGGPILVVTTSADLFSTYYAEILRTEGLNEFLTRDISMVDATLLNNYDVVILASMALTPTQAAMFSAWVDAGGNLIAINPDADLAALLGLQAPIGTTEEGYVLVNTASAPGAGIVGQTIQFHGSASHWALNGAIQVAELYTNATTTSGFPAVTLRSAGSNGGQAVAFTYDLARSIVYTRQGNPAWAGQKRDGAIPPIRSDDLFYPDWVDFNKIAIPQADEQQRLLANLIAFMNLDRKPLPKFWYFPRDEKAVVIMTGDDHASGGTVGRFDQQKNIQSPVGCNVANWECVRSTSYIYPNTPLSDAQALGYHNDGFEIAMHPAPGCGNFTLSSLSADFTSMLADFTAKYTSIPPPSTNRTHCIAWSDWDSEPIVELAHGIRLDTNYYYWPASWILDRPGMFTGSGMPMRFAKLDGTMIDVYQATTQMPDESGETFPLHIDTLLDNAIGALGYYGAFTANMHTDSASSSGSDAIIASAQARSVPVVSGRQMLEWLDGRNGSSFGSIAWNGNTLSFTISVGAGANGLRAMVPTSSSAGVLTGVTRGGSPVALTTQTIKGVEFAFFDGLTGSYEATYSVDEVAPVVTDLQAAAASGDGTATITWTTNEASDSRVDYGTNQNTLNLNVANAAFVTAHSIVITGLAANTTYYFRVVSKDAANNSTTEPAGPTPASFTTPQASLTDTTVSEFNGGTIVTNTYISETGNGEIILTPTVGAEFLGAALPIGWSSGTWEFAGGGAGGSVTVSGGSLHVNGAFASTDATFGPGNALEFTATFGAASNQHVGFSDNFNSTWAIFSTFNTTGQLYARTHFAGDNDVAIPGSFIGSSHLYRIEWDLTQVRFYVDNNPVAVSVHNGNFPGSLRPIASDFNAGGPELAVDWMRMSPYASPGTFESRIFDAGEAVNWGALSWITDLPAGTDVALSVRIGNTPTPDGTWSIFAPVASSGGSIGGNSRYLQYRAVLSSTNLGLTPSVSSVTASFSEGVDTVAPTITSHVPAPNATGVSVATNVAVGFSEPMDATSFDTTRLRLRAQGAGSDVPASISVVGSTATLDPSADLLPNKLYTVTLSGDVTDLASNPLGSVDTWTFTTGALTSTFVDDTTSDFGGGNSTAGGTYIAETANGEVILSPTEGAEFYGTSLPAGWESGTWEFAGGGAGGSATVSGGLFQVNGAFARAVQTYPAGRVIEFEATFSGQAFQNIGLGVDLNNDANWAVFGYASNGSAFLARTNNGTPIDTPITNVAGAAHRFRIEWDVGEVRFFVDGALVATNVTTIATTMRPIVSDYLAAGTGVAVNWMRMSPYASPGTFESRVFDAGSSIDWTTLTSQTTTPLLTGISFETRTGNTPTPDGTWTSFASVSSSLIASDNGRYLQYRAMLTSSNPNITPILERVELNANQLPVCGNSSVEVGEVCDDGNTNSCDACSADCQIIDQDSDEDGTFDLCETCDNDPFKTSPGICGCGVSDVDTDNDATADCFDGCPIDPAKIAPGVCGCGVSDADTDNDGTPNCSDGCPIDPAKVAPGACGCGVSDADTDNDGTPNCSDGCPIDPAKIAPGVCGCGVPDTNSDGDGEIDCLEPVFNQNLPNRTDPEGTIISLSAAATDPNTPVLTYSASGLPGGLSINTTSGLISGTINSSAASGSPYSVIITVSDNAGGIANDTFTWTVTDVPQGIAFRSASSNRISGSASLSIGKPSGLVAGYVMLASITTRSSGAIGAPAGWTLVRTNASGSTLRMSTFVKVVGASEPGSYSFTLGANTSATGGIVAYSGVSNSHPIDASAGIVNGNSFVFTAPSINTTVSGTVLVASFGIANDPNIVLPLGLAERVVVKVGGTKKATTEIADQARALAGATGPRYTLGSSLAVSIGHSVALRPAP